MKYRVLISEAAIPDPETVERLEDLGLIVPFVTSDPDFNIYAYQPETSDVPLKEIRLLHYFDDSTYFISQSELDRHNTKVVEHNSVEIGDSVKISGYRNLVTTVEKIEGDLITTKINLRGFYFRFTNKSNKISKASSVYLHKEYEFNNKHNNTLFVDLTEFEELAASQNRFDYIQSVFYLLLRLKLSFTKLNIVLLSPSFDIDRLFGLSSLRSAHPLRDLIEYNVDPQAYIYTPDKSQYRADRNIITNVPNKNIESLTLLTKDVFKRVTGLESGQHYQVFLRLIEKNQNMTPRPLVNEDQMKRTLMGNDSRLRSTHPECFLIETHTKPTDLDFNSYELDSEDLYKSLLDDGFVQIVENLDYYMNIIKG